MNTGTNNTPTPLVYNDVVISERGEMLSLTNMWVAAGSDPSQEPAKWRKLPSSADFIAHLVLVLGKSEDQLLQTTRGGRGGKASGTWAHWQIGLAYAKYLSHDFHMWCNTVVRERMEGASLPLGIPADVLEMIRRTDGIARQLSHKVTVMEQAVDRLEAAKVTPTFDYAGTVTSNQIIELAGILPAQRVRGTSSVVTHAMFDFCNGMGCVRTEKGLNPSRPWRFPTDKAREWLFGSHLGSEQIRNQIARQHRSKRKSGQESLRLVTPFEGATP